jgi:hypothetical protein
MKKITLALFVFGAFIFNAEAQENKTIKEVSTVKRVVKKEGSQVIVTEVEEIEKVKGTVMVAGNEEENQFFKEDSTTVDDKNVLVDEVTIDKNNEALVIAEKKRQEEEMIKSQAEAKAKIEAEKKILDQQAKDRVEALEKNRKKLEKRSKGTGKLKKKRKNN